MKIGLVCPYNMFKGGGVQECVIAMQNELQSRGHDAVIISPQPNKHKDSQMDNVIFLGTAAQMKSPFHTTAQVSVSVKTELLGQVLDDEQFDILHFHEPWVPILSRQILSRSKSVNVATFHAKLPDTIMSKTIEKVITPYTKSILKEINSFTAVSDAAAEYVRSLSDQKVEIIPNGIDVSKYKANGKHLDKSILYIGRLEKRKGLKYLLSAFSKTVTPGVKLLIAGEGSDKLKLQRHAKFLKITDNVEFLGHISENQKLSLLAESSVFCSPALFGESFGIVLLEAMATRIPVVAGDNPGYSSVLTNEGGLGLVNPKDVKSFARTLDIYLNSPSARTAWQNWASNNIEQYDYSKIVDKYEKLYTKVLRNK